MFRNYLKIALRNLRKQRGLTFINIAGLAMGLACCLLIMLYVADELSYDRFNAKADRIYRIHTDVKFGGTDSKSAVSADPIGPTLKQNYPQVEQFVRLHQRGTWLVKRAGSANSLREENITFADSTLFDVFTLPLIAGDPKRALTQPNTVVISESAAKRHFGNQDPMGQTLTFNTDQSYKVTGVMRDMPVNSHFRSDFFLAMLSDDYRWGQWLSNNHHTYIVLREGTDYRQFEKNFEAIIEKYVGPQALQFIGVTLAQFRQAGNRFEFSLMPLTDIHLHSKETIQLAPNGDIQYVYIFSAVGLFILLIAGINFMNLATARSASRAKEVGVRKVLGSERHQLIGQFMTESVLMTGLAMGLALLIVAVAIPFFNTLAAKELSVRSLLSPYWLVVLVALPIAVGLLAGSYPAIFLSSFRPISVLKGGTAGAPVRSRKINVSFNRSGLRSGLVVFQFMMSVVLIVGTIIVYRQITYIQSKNLGFNRDQVLTVNDVDALGKQAETFKQEVLRLPGVVSGSISGYLPTPSYRSSNSFFPEGKIDQTNAMSMQVWGIDHDYVKTLGMTMAQGRDFSRNFGSDSSGVILNETAAKLLGGSNLIGKRIVQFTNPQEKTSIKTYTVIGVVKNFHFESLRHSIGALAMVLDANSGAASFRMSSTNLPALIGQIETKWKQVAPGQPFSYTFLEDRFDAMYRAEQRIGTIALTFAVLAILIACLGLFGLVAFMAEQRTKEIGVRKVLGASIMSIVALLSKDFLKLVLIAILIASPIAWYAMNRWLQDFAYKITIDWWIFALAGLLAIGIALLTVSFQSVKAALMNPVKSLRSE
jgi:putative ABC transport system permease protein